MKSLLHILIAATTAQALSINKRTDDAFKKHGYTTTFLDTFSGPTTSLPSPSNWIFDLGTSYPGGYARWGNNEFETYTSSPSNIHITAQNHLAIIPLLTSSGWTSARIETQRDDFQVQEGGKILVEARIKLGTAEKKHQQGIWPAFWALGSTYRGNYTNWPSVSEWDIMEVINGDEVMYTTAHNRCFVFYSSLLLLDLRQKHADLRRECGVAPGGPCNEYSGIGNNGATVFERGVWHVVGFEVDRSCEGGWESESLSWWLNGEKMFSILGREVGDEGAWGELARGRKFLLLNVAVGGNWPGVPNNMTIGGKDVGMEVDYVGVWNSVEAAA